MSTATLNPDLSRQDSSNSEGISERGTPPQFELTNSTENIDTSPILASK